MATANPNTTPPVSPLQLVKVKFNDLIKEIDELKTETEQDLAFDYIAGVMTTEGYVIADADMVSGDGPREYNINTLFNSFGATKNPRLDELGDAAMQRRQGVEVTSGIHTALDVAEAIVTRSGIPDSVLREDLIEVIKRGLNMHIPNPATWLNSQVNFVANRTAGRPKAKATKNG